MKQRKLRLPAGAIPISPCTDFTLRGESLKSVDDPIISARTMPWFRDLYFPKFAADVSEAQRREAYANPLASPAFGSYEGLPPLLIQVGEHEMLRDDAVLVATKCAAAGCDAQLEIWPGMVHVFQSRDPLLPEAKEAIDHIADFIRAKSKK